jgi:hypothetical protein
LSDLLVLGPARIANVQRIHGGIWLAKSAMRKALAVAETVQMGPYVEAELANLNASVLKDEGMELLHAERESDHAIEVFAKFDSHLAARAMVTKAACQRLQEKAAYMVTFEQAIEGLDGPRDFAAVETVHNIFLYYLVKEGRIDDAARNAKILPWPTLPAYQASRAQVEGCISFARKNFDDAEIQLTDSVQRFSENERLGDAEIPLLYRAGVHSKKKSFQAMRLDLEAAERIARSCGFIEAVAIRRLIKEIDRIEDLTTQILEIAFEAGGCLGPLTPRHEDSNR